MKWTPTASLRLTTILNWVALGVVTFLMFFIPVMAKWYDDVSLAPPIFLPLCICLYLSAGLGLTALLQRQPTQLSGGQQQRVAIARALITRPAVVLADEPTGNLDHQNSVEVFRLLREAAAQQHQTVVYVTHDQGLAAQADRVLRMQDGRIEEA